MDRIDRRTVEDLENFVPYLLHVSANRLASGASRTYRRMFGITVSEWHMLLILSTERNITANRACQIIGLDRSLASRLVRTLERRGLVRVGKHPADNRQRAINLTPKGWRLHAQVDEVSKERSRRLLSIFDEKEYRLLLNLLKRLNSQVPQANAYESSPRGRGARDRRKPA